MLRLKVQKTPGNFRCGDPQRGEEGEVALDYVVGGSGGNDAAVCETSVDLVAVDSSLNPIRKGCTTAPGGPAAFGESLKVNRYVPVSLAQVE